MCALAASAAFCAAAFAAANGACANDAGVEAGDERRRGENRRKTPHGIPALPAGAPFGGRVRDICLNSEMDVEELLVLFRPHIGRLARFVDFMSTLIGATMRGSEPMLAMNSAT